MKKKTNLFTMLLEPFRREKYEEFINNSEFTTLKQFLCEAADQYIANPDLRNPIKEPSDLMKSFEKFKKYNERKQREERNLKNSVIILNRNLEIQNSKLGLILKELNISDIKIKKAEKRNIDMDLIINGKTDT